MKSRQMKQEVYISNIIAIIKRIEELQKMMEHNLVILQVV